MKIERVTTPSRYWVYGKYLVHFITNSNESNRNLTPIIYIHGLGGSSDDYSELIKVNHPSKSSRPYYAIDLPPFGKSAVYDSDLSIHQYAELLQEFISMIPSEKVSLVCHSMGGQVCIDYALTNSEKIQLLTLVSPAGVYQRTAYINKTLNYYAGISVGQIDHPHARSLSDISWYSQEFTRKFITNNPITLVAIESYKENFHSRIKNLRTKTLIIWGRNDTVFNFENGLYLKENIENSTLYILENADHFPLKDRAEYISGLIFKYL